MTQTTGLRTRLSWGIGDQALSSLTNFFAGIMIAKSVGIVDFGAYALAFSAYCLFLAASRALSTEPFAVRYSRRRDDGYRAMSACSGIALATGLLLGFALIGAALVLRLPHADLLLVLGLILPGLLLQDSFRLMFFTIAEGRKAFANDLVWALLTIPGFLFLLAAGSNDVAAFMLVWGLAGTVAGLVGILQCRQWPKPHQSVRWLAHNRSLWPRYICEGIAINGSQQMTMFIIGIFAGLAGVGQLKLVMVLLGPVNVLVQGLGAISVAECGRALVQGRGALTRMALRVSAIIASGAAGWGLVVLFSPDAWGVALVGAGWMTAAVLVLPAVLVQVFNGLSTGAVAALRAMGAARRSMWTRIGTSSQVVVAVTCGAALGGVYGAAWALALAAGINLITWLVTYHRTGPHHRTIASATDTTAYLGTAQTTRDLTPAHPGRG
ncbi:membrane protein [Arthrobacter tecti]